MSRSVQTIMRLFYSEVRRAGGVAATSAEEESDNVHGEQAFPVPAMCRHIQRFAGSSHCGRHKGDTLNGFHFNERKKKRMFFRYVGSPQNQHY